MNAPPRFTLMLNGELTDYGSAACDYGQRYGKPRRSLKVPRKLKKALRKWADKYTVYVEPVEVGRWDDVEDL